MLLNDFKAIKSRIYMLKPSERIRKIGPSTARTPCIINNCNSKRAAVAVKFERVMGARHWATVCSKHLKEARWGRDRAND